MSPEPSLGEERGRCGPDQSRRGAGRRRGPRWCHTPRERRMRVPPRGAARDARKSARRTHSSQAEGTGGRARRIRGDQGAGTTPETPHGRRGRPPAGDRTDRQYRTALTIPCQWIGIGHEQQKSSDVVDLSQTVDDLMGREVGDIDARAESVLLAKTRLDHRCTGRPVFVRSDGECNAPVPGCQEKVGIYPPPVRLWRRDTGHAVRWVRRELVERPRKNTRMAAGASGPAPPAAARPRCGTRRQAPQHPPRGGREMRTSRRRPESPPVSRNLSSTNRPSTPPPWLRSSTPSSSPAFK